MFDDEVRLGCVTIAVAPQSPGLTAAYTMPANS